MGECELIAISKTTNGEYIIVTNDNGKVYKHPDQNLFDTDAVGSEIVYLSGEEWIKEIGYNFGAIS